MVNGQWQMDNESMNRIVHVNVPQHPYDVVIDVGLLGRAGEVLRTVHGRGGRAVVITDSNVGPLYAEALAASLAKADYACSILTFPAGEASKTLATYGSLMEQLLASTPPIDRRTVIVALGGGVTGDLAGFVAATALRGLSFINIPTTLLADVDSSVGGKTGVDSAAGKNLIGAFHQPRAVLIDPAMLATLPVEQVRNGLAECVKHAVIRDAELLEMISRQAEAILAKDAAVLAELIARNVAIKAGVVAADEREASIRADLNFGHTVGHALEAAGGFGALGHGQAVALGMIAANTIAVGRRLLSRADSETVESVLRKLGLPVRLADLPHLPAQAAEPARLLDLMTRDKKARAGRARFVLATHLGRAAIYDDVTEQEIRAALAAIGAR
jgi:3-dehydroquinate synthase